MGGWMEGRVDGWMDGSQSWVKDCLQQSINFSINKPKMVRFLKIKFLIILKLKYNRGQFYTKILNFDYLKNLEIFHLYKV